jgi:N-acetylglucosaminyl-diphospho-decaprenol L-rhamnosyltransferase
MKLAIIIVNWNTRDLLAQCLESLLISRLSSSVPGLRSSVFVVDNASSDGSTQMLRERFPQVHLIENQENLGFARANNQALRQSPSPFGRGVRGEGQGEGQQDFVLLLNPDTLVHPGALEALTRFMLDHPHCGAAGARLLNPDGTPQISAYPFPTLLREFWRLFHLDARYPLSCYPPSRWKTDISQEVDSVQGAVLLLRQQTLDQVGLLDEDYFIFSEEVDLCQRIKSAGWEIYWLPGAEVIHYGGQSTRQVAPQMFLELYRGKVLYFRKRHNRLSAWVYKLILLLAALPRIALAPLPACRQLAGHYAQLVRALPGM